MKRSLAGLLLVAVGIPVVASATATWQQNPTKNKARRHVMVQFTDSSLHPSIAQVLEGGTVSWVNYSEMYSGMIVFSNEVAKAFKCSDLRPNWSKTGSGYQSIPITSDGADNDLQIPCPLKPGEYEYEVWLFDEEPDNPQAQMQGKIIVQ